MAPTACLPTHNGCLNQEEGCQNFLRRGVTNSYIQETNRFGSSSESPESSENVENDDSWKPESQEIQPERVEAINTLLKLNGQKKEFVHRMQKPFHKYSQQKKCEQMELLSASVEAVINTFSAVKSDQINIWHTVVDGHYMDERLGNTKSMGSLLKDMIEAICVD